jgi:hypothetical protein
VVVIEAEVDDMNPQFFGGLIESLLADGALDAFYTPIYMKKGRPGTLITVIAPPAARERLSARSSRDDDDRRALPRRGPRGTGPRGRRRADRRRRDPRRRWRAVTDTWPTPHPSSTTAPAPAAATGRPVKEIHGLAVSAFYDRFTR